MHPLPSIRRWLSEPRELERGVLMRRTGITLHAAGFLYALCYAVLFAAPDAAVRVALCGLAFGLIGLTLWRLPARAEYATISALTSTAIISVILVTQDVTTAVPLFYLWPMSALAYFHSPRFLTASLVWMAATLAPAMLIGGTIQTQVIYLSTISNTVLIAALVAVVRRDEQRLRRSLQQGSSTDALTGLLNRRAFAPALAELLVDAGREGDGVVVALIDLDHFKRFNDTHGHVAGDAALRRTAAVLQSAAAPGDLVARLGGEEFALVLRGRGIAAAQRLCDRIAATLGPAGAPGTDADPLDRAGLRAALRAQLHAVETDADAELVATEERPLPDGSAAGELPPLTASYGLVLHSPRDGADPETLLARADDALYDAKRAGRDRVAVWSEHGPMLGPSIHIAGLLTDPDLAPIDAPDANELAEPDAHTFLGRRAKVLFRVAAAMFIGGGLNTIAGVAILDMSPDATRWQLGIGSVAILLGLVLLVARGSLRYAGVIGFVGIAMVSAVVATVEPLISAPLFYAWPVALVANFARPRTTAWAMGWVTVSLVAAVTISAQAVDAVGLLAGVLLNMVMLGGLVTALRWREERLAEVLAAAAAIDPLTGALTRRAFLPAVEGWLRAQRPGLTLLLADVDHFKRYNDEHGHLAGDDALRQAAAALRAAAPADALVCRFGGEEFAIVLPSGGLGRARACADQIAVELSARSGGALTLSTGIAVAHRGELYLEPLVARADQGLYAAKRAGRARVAWFAADAGDSLVVAEPIRVTRPPAFEVIVGQDDLGRGEAASGLSSAA